MTSPSFIDLLLQFLDHASNILRQVHPLLHNLIAQSRPLIQTLKSNPLILQYLAICQDLYGKLPESATLALTVAVMFLTTLMVFRVGRTVIGALVTFIQISILLVVGFVIWKLRDPLSAWFEHILNQ